MPRKPKVDRDAVLAVLAETGSKQETATRLGIHYNTVRNVERIAEGLCYRCARKMPDGSTKTLCDTCLTYAAKHVRAAARKNQAQGRCISCAQPIEPPSTTFCALHRKLRSGDATRQRQRDRARLGDTAFKKQQRDRARTSKYGPAVNVVLEASGGLCAICAIACDGRSRHIHHVDRTHSNGSESNMIVLCSSCHHTIHALFHAKNLRRALVWAKEHYPSLDL